MFYINYNSHDVAVEYNGGIYIIKAESFVNVKDIQAADLSDLNAESITNALKPTAGQLKRYETAKENYEEALLTGNQALINKAKESLNNAIEAIGNRTAENVLKVVSTDGKTVSYFNYETATILVPVS